MKDEVVVLTGDKVLRINPKVWLAFLEASSLMVDTGDMYPHLEHKLGNRLLDAVKEMKMELDEHAAPLRR